MANRLGKIAEVLNNEMEKLDYDYTSGNITDMTAFTTAMWFRESITDLFCLADKLYSNHFIESKEYNKVVHYYRKIVDHEINLVYTLHHNGFNENEGGNEDVGRSLHERTEIPFSRTGRTD